MKITKLNYELFAIDYLEGNLSREEKQLFDQFLEKYPEAKEELSDYLEAPLLIEDDSITFINKDQHLKPRKLAWLMPVLLTGIILSTTVYVFQRDTSSSELAPPMKIETPIKQTNSEAALLVEIEVKVPSTTTENKIAPNTKLNEAKQVTQTKRKSNTIHKTTHTIAEVKQAHTTATSTIQPAITKQIAIANQVAESQQEPARELVKIAQLNQLPFRAQAAIVSTEKNRLISDRKMTYLIDLNVGQNENENKWWSILTPKAFEGISIKDAFASNGLSSTLNELNSRK